MAEVLLDPITLQSNATVISNASRIFYGGNVELSADTTVIAEIKVIKYADSSIQSSGTLNGRIVKVVKSSSALSAIANVPPISSRVIKYVRSTIASKANVSLNAHKFKTVKAELIGRTSVETYIYDRDIKESMTGYLPPFYQDFKDIRHLIATEANEFTRLNAKLDELLLQFNVGTATYSMADWEKFTNAKRKNTISARRNEVMKRINGIGTVTPEVLEDIVDSYHESEMIELPEPGVIQFKFKERGRLDGVDEIEEEVNELIPRHLEPVFSFTFLPWNELDMIRRPWSELSDLKFRVISDMKWRDLEGTGIRWKQLERLTFRQIEESYNLNKIGEAQHE